MHTQRNVATCIALHRNPYTGLIICLMALVAWITPLTILAQSAAGNIVGTVRDASGAIVVNATVTLVQTGTDVTKTVKTLSSGDYTFSFVQPGDYLVKVDAPGFKASERAVRVDLAATSRADFDLSIGSVGSEVTVLASTPSLQTDSAEVSHVISQRSVNELPLNGRHYSDLILLTPGTTLSAAGTSDTPL